MEIPKKFQISFYKNVRNKQYYVEVLTKRFRLNGKTISFRLQIQVTKKKIISAQLRPLGKGGGGGGGEGGNNPVSVTLNEAPEGIVAPP